MAIAIWSSACGDAEVNGNGRGPGVSVTPIALDVTDVFDVAWVDVDTLAISRPGASGPVDAVWKVGIAGTGLDKIELPQPEECRLVGHRSPQLLVDGRLGLVRDCEGRPLEFVVKRTAVALDLDDGTVEELVPLRQDERYEDGTSRNAVTASTVAWDRTLTRGFTQDGGDCATILSVDRTGAHPLDVEIGTSGRRWNLADFATSHEPGEGCDGWGSAGLPKTSPASDDVVFFASPQSIGIGSATRMPDRTADSRAAARGSVWP